MNDSFEWQVLSQRAVGQHIIKYLSMLDRWSCFQVFPTWRGLDSTPVILASGSDRNRTRITRQLTTDEEDSSLLVRDERGLALFIDILNTRPISGLPSFNLVSMDLQNCFLTVSELNKLFSGSNVGAYPSLQTLLASVQHETRFSEDGQIIWNGNKAVLVEPIQPLPNLKKLSLLISPMLSVNSTPLAKLLRICINASEISLRDRDGCIPWRQNFIFVWYTRHNHPQSYPNLTHLSVSVYSEFISALLMESKGDYKAWFPVLKNLTLYAPSNYMKAQDLEGYREIFQDVSVEVPPYTVGDWAQPPCTPAN